ncbi:GAF domain-containing protein [Granulicella sp. dw_53]|uniref:GAF domain-containing protein n=1 Tax=Granulicella sp. dw_53 TaxID=2719792 RepID=UPI001BD2B3E1|nr:GAF domain-containing protein [Granulicella sp. dw_53]
MSDFIVNLDNCAREPIHIPGAIQPHGVMFVLNEPDLSILQVSNNTEYFIGLSPNQLLEKGLESFLLPAQVDRVRFALNTSDPTENNPVDLQLRSRQEGIELQGVGHRYDGFSILELEAAVPADSTHFLDFYKTVSKTTGRLQLAPTLKFLLDEAAEGLREVTGFDRVMIYRFAPNGEGEVVAESRIASVEPYLGLWYPASDIPEQARRMYALSPIRSIPDVAYKPVPLTPAINPVSRRPTDLTYAGLRSVSPIHCEYLTNMGVLASTSISILRDGKLWGLISCHHYSPKVVHFELRKACTFLGQVLSGEIVRREIEEESAYSAQSNAIQARFLELMAGSSDPLLALLKFTPNLLNLIPAAGAAIVVGDQVQTLGITPSYTELLTLVDSLRKMNVPSTFFTNSLKNNFAAAEKFTQTASGVIALEISRHPLKCILYFRPEIAQTVTWAGNPDKPVLPTEDGFRLAPRASFAAWKEEVRGTASPWTASERRVADDLRNLVTAASFRRNAATAG